MKPLYHLTYATQGLPGSHWFTDLPSAAIMANALAHASCFRDDVTDIEIASINWEDTGAYLVSKTVTGVPR